MLEYIFFDERPWRRFIEFLDEQKLAPIISHGPEEWVVGLPEDLDDELDARIEAFYDEMLAYNEALVTEEEGAQQVHTTGINVTLKDGRQVQAAIDPLLMNRLLEAVTPEELGVFVNAIVDAVEHPDERSLCQR